MSTKQSFPFISVIIGSYNSEAVVHQTLAGLFSQSYTRFEVVALDYGSSDRTMDIVNQYNCRIVRPQPVSLHEQAVLKEALGTLRGDIIVLWNAEAVPLHSETLESLIEAFDDEEIQLAYARTIPYPGVDDWIQNDETSLLAERPACYAPLIAMRKAVWLQYPMASEPHRMYELGWSEWAVQNGYSIRYVPSSLIMFSQKEQMIQHARELGHVHEHQESYHSINA